MWNANGKGGSVHEKSTCNVNVKVDQIFFTDFAIEYILMVR